MSAAVTTVIESKKRKQDEISTMATTSSYVPVIGKSNTKAPNKKMFWQWTVDEIGQWMRGLQALFPPKPECKSIVIVDNSSRNMFASHGHFQISHC